MTYCKLLLRFALLLNFYFFAFRLNVFQLTMMFHKWAMLSAWVCYLTQLRVFSDALWIRCTVCIEYSPIYLNYLKPWTCVYLRYTSGTALHDTRTVGRYKHYWTIFYGATINVLFDCHPAVDWLIHIIITGWFWLTRGRLRIRFITTGWLRIIRYHTRGWQWLQINGWLCRRFHTCGGLRFRNSTGWWLWIIRGWQCSKKLI